MSMRVCPFCGEYHYTFNFRLDGKMCFDCDAKEKLREAKKPQGWEVEKDDRKVIRDPPIREPQKKERERQAEMEFQNHLERERRIAEMLSRHNEMIREDEEYRQMGWASKAAYDDYMDDD